MSLTTPGPPPIPAVALIIRFSASVPDRRLSIAFPQCTSAANLCTLVRPDLPADLASCPLRFIYAGALLPPNTALDGVLRLDITGASLRPASALPPPPRQFYIHCSISSNTHLTPAEITAEAQSAANFTSRQEEAVAARTSSSSTANDNLAFNQHGPNTSNATSETPSTRPIIQSYSSPHHTTAQPQGFDRLLATGFTPTEVASLRSQFLAIQAHTHTPDTMPSGPHLRALEDEWLDNASGPGGGSGSGMGISDATGGAGSGGGEFDTGDAADVDGTAGALEDMLWGNLIGFFWAVGAIVWLVREEGVWTKRRQVAVLTGFLVNIAFCVLRAGS